MLAIAFACITRTTSAQEACCADVCIGGADDVCNGSECSEGFESCICAGACDSRAIECVADACFARKDKAKVSGAQGSRATSGSLLWRWQSV